MMAISIVDQHTILSGHIVITRQGEMQSAGFGMVEKYSGQQVEKERWD
jgi:hypothetical protein